MSQLNLVSIDYDFYSLTLELEFTSGAIHQYHQVPPNIYEELKGASNPNAYFKRFIMKKFNSWQPRRTL